MDRETKVTKCGEIQNSLFNDRVSIEFSPFELETLERIFEQRAINAIRYNEQGDERDMHELFGEGFKMWEKARKEKKDNWPL